MSIAMAEGDVWDRAERSSSWRSFVPPRLEALGRQADVWQLSDSSAADSRDLWQAAAASCGILNL